MLEGLDHAGLHHVNEAFTRLAYTAVVRAGETVLDVGANSGEHTAELARLVGPGGRVHAFEPNVAHYGRLVALGPPVRLWPVALGDVLSVERLSVPAGLDGWASLHPLDALLPGRSIERQAVVQVPLDRLEVPVTGRLSFVKIDVEGHELQVLEGGRELLLAHRPVMVVENVTAEISAWARARGFAARDFLGVPLDDPRATSGPAKLVNAVLVPVERPPPRAPFLDPGSREVAQVLREARALSRR